MPYPLPSRTAQARIRCRQTPHNRARPPRPASRCARTSGTPSLRRDGKGLWRCYHRRTRMSIQQRARLRHQSDISGFPLEGGTLQWLVDRELGAQHVMAYRLALDPDSALSHVHRGTEEVLYVLEGSGEVRVEGVTHHVAPGHAVFVPAGAEHTYVNTGAESLTLVGAMAPPIELGEIRPAIPRLDGTGRPRIEDQPVGDLRAGSVVFFPIGVRHTLENSGRDDMKVLGAFSPAGSPEAKLPPSH